MKIQEIAPKINPESHVLGVVLDQDIEYLLQSRLMVTKANLTPQEWEGLISKCNAKIVEYLKNDRVFEVIRAEAENFIIERSFNKCDVLV